VGCRKRRRRRVRAESLWGVSGEERRVNIREKEKKEKERKRERERKIEEGREERKIEEDSEEDREGEAVHVPNHFLVMGGEWCAVNEDLAAQRTLLLKARQNVQERCLA